MSSDGWVAVTHPGDLALAVGVARSAITGEAYSIVTGLLSRESYWQTRLEDRSRPGEMFHYEVGRTRLFFNWTEAKRVGDDVLILGIVYLSTQNLPLATLLGLARKLRESFKVLTADETEVVRVIMGIAAPASAYDVGVAEARVKAAYQEATVDINGLLDSLQAKKIIRAERPGKLRLIV